MRTFLCQICGRSKTVDLANPHLEAEAKYCSPECRREAAVRTRKERDLRVSIDWRDSAELLALEMETQVKKARLVRLAVRFMLTCAKKNRIDIEDMLERYRI